MALNGNITYGNQGDVLGTKQQAIIEKLATAEIAQKTIFDKFATRTRAIPQNQGKTLTFRRMVNMKDLLIANKIYKEYTGNNVEDRGEGIVTLVDKDYYKQFILPEGESGDQIGDVKVVEFSTDIFPIGFWSKVTEEVSLFHDLWTTSWHVKQLSEIASYAIDGFYRDLYINSAGHQIDISGNASGSNRMKDSAFTDANRKVTMQLRLSGARYVDRILSNSPNYGTVPIQTKYVAIVNPLCEFDLRENPDFIPVEKYPDKSKVMDNEIGTIGEVRYVYNENMLIEDDGTNKYGYALILGKEHTYDIPLRGKGRIETIIKGLNTQDKSDPLNRIQIIGIKSWLGAYSVYPERMALLKAKIEY